MTRPVIAKRPLIDDDIAGTSGRSAVAKSKISQCSSKHFLALIACTFLLQFTLVSFSFPITELVSQKPLFHSDAAYHWYHMKTGVNLAQSSEVVGYDPYFGAGYPGGLNNDPSARAAVFASILFQRWFNEVVAYKLCVFIASLLAPLMLVVALRWLGFEAALIAVGTGLAFVLWWTSLFRWYHTAGMISFVLGSYLGVPFLVAIARYLSGHGGKATVAGLAIAGSFGFFYHPLFPVPIAIGCLILFAAFWRSIRWQTILGLTVIAVISLVSNLFWIVPTQSYGVLREFRGSYQAIVDASMIWRELMGRWDGQAQGSKEYALLAFAALWAWLAVPAGWDRKIVRAMTIAAVVLIVFAAIGASIPKVGMTLQPNRFAPVGYLMLVIPATYGIREILRRSLTSSPGKMRVVGLVSLIAVCLAGVYLVNEVRREVSYADVGHFGSKPPEVKGLGEYSQWVVNWLEQHTTAEGRILFETSKARIYDGAQMAGYYAYTANREFIGGPYPYMHFTGFWDGWLFDKPIASIGHKDFDRYMDLYNVGWILVHSEDSKRYLDGYPNATPLGNFKQLRAYQVTRSLNYFVEGSGKLSKREHNKVTLSDLSGDRIVVKYHFVPGMTSAPGARLEKVHLMDDPTPFLEIVNPPKEISFSLP